MTLSEIPSLSYVTKHFQVHIAYGQCDARPTIVFLIMGPDYHLDSIKLYCLVREAHVCV